MDEIFTFDKYIKNPLLFPFDINTEKVGDIKSFQKFFSVFGNSILIKRRNLKKTVQELIQSNALKPFEFKTIFELRSKAFMKDEGCIYFSLGLLITKSPTVLLSVFCHELAHVFLSRQSNYEDLKKLNKEFKEKFNSVKEVNLLSPIEVFAMLLSVNLMEEIQKHISKDKYKNKFGKIIREEYQKLNCIEKKIKTLKK